MVVSASSSSVTLLFELQPLRNLQRDEGSLQDFARKSGELADLAAREFPSVELMKESHQTPAKGVFEIVTALVIAVGTAAQAGKQLADSLSTLIGKLRTLFPNNEVVIVYPDQTRVVAKVRGFTPNDLAALHGSIVRNLRDTDLSKAESATYLITLQDRRSHV